MSLCFITKRCPIANIEVCPRLPLLLRSLPRYSFSSSDGTRAAAAAAAARALNCCQEEKSRHIRVEKSLLESLTHTNTVPLWASRLKSAVEGLSAPKIARLIVLTEAGLFRPRCFCHGRNMRLSVSSFTSRLLNELDL